MAQLTMQLDEQSDGFRLHCLEVYNWGTFNRQVWTVEPRGNTALLTGANGSGKSTLVDALLTLLVPNLKRNYNQASGADKRRERDEKTYVRGAYGRTKDEENNRGVVQFLREHNEYAVLLASFANARLGQDVTLAHVFFWRSEELGKFFVVAPRRLSIADDLRITSTPDELRKRLRAAGAEVYDEFAKYSRQVIKLFGLRSEKALDLFNQTVSIKEIGGLSDFVRQHMLERTDAQEKITELRETYQNLTAAHDAIAKAEQQLARLAPMLAEAEQYAQMQARIAEAERCAELTPFFFAQRKLALAEHAIGDAQARRTEHQGNAATLQTQVDTLRRQEISLNIDISNDTAGQQLQRLRQEITHVAELRRGKKNRADTYNTTARTLGLSVYSDSETFFNTAKQAREALAPIDKRLQTIVSKRDEHKQEEGRLVGVCRELRAEIDSLRQRKSRIPSEDLYIRAALADALHIGEDELPFIGELLKVGEQTLAWEGAIERLLRGYGRQMLVPGTYYRQVSGYVDGTNLHGRLVFHRVDERRTPRSTAGFDDAALIFKLEIKPDSAFHDWLKADLLEHWDYVCCDTLEQFGRERRALTINGQTKRSGGQHEKDDRFDIRDRTKYVLGWDNREKIAALEEDYATQSAALKAAQAEIVKLETEQKQRAEQRRLLLELLSFDDFAVIDWQAEERRLSELEAQKRALEASSDRLAHLQVLLAKTTDQLKRIESNLRQVQALTTTCETDIARYTRQREQSVARLQSAPLELLQAHTARIEAEVKQRALTLDTVDDIQNQIRDTFIRSANAQRGNATNLANGIIGKMVNFKRDYPEDTTEMDATVASIEEFRRMRERIERDDLPVYRRRFKEWLDDKVVQAIVGFWSALNKKEEEYRESIATLNTALRTIAYTPATYIQLTNPPNRDVDIRDFRQILRSCIPDVGQRTPEANEASFQRIRALIARFEKEERWTDKVTDVRNWLEFAAEERYNEDHAVKQYYSDSAGKSGGQKAKLAYTILASAIAYQYGLDQDTGQARTFRFVVVDEAFSKSDETNARYAMDLFKQLNLQLLVVTPMDKTHVVEPYIAACHFVTNNQDENDSRVLNMTIREYHDQKDRFMAQTGP